MSDSETTLALAHALRTPLTSLALGLGMLDEGALGPLNEAQREVVTSLVADVARLSLLVARELRIEHLGAYAGPIELVRTDLAGLVERAGAPLREQARERGIELTWESGSGIAAIVDPVKMTWVIASLLGNALRYAPRGSLVRARLVRCSREIELTVTDEGPGMAPEIAAQLFERGGGLGLVLAREIIEAHGGSIMVHSEQALGSTFVIRLPAAV